MKKIYRDKILNVPDTDIFDNTFVFEYLIPEISSLPFGENWEGDKVEIIYLRDLLEKKKNSEILEKVKQKPAMWSEVYSPKDELDIFTELFESALKNKKKIHIVWVTLGEEIKMLEEYYESLWFIREDINAFEVDFSKVLVSASCHIENLMWRGSDYKAQREKIFFCPPVRESGQNKALFKWITRWVLAGIELWELTQKKQDFLSECIIGEKIMPLHMGKVLKYNLEDRGFRGGVWVLQIVY